jgi:hypothetical protein
MTSGSVRVNWRAAATRPWGRCSQPDTHEVAPLMEHAKELTDPERTGAIFLAVAAACGALCGLLYPVVLLVFMTRPSLKAALR